MELIGFIVLLVLGIAAIIFDRIEIIKYLYIPLLFSFMVIVRLNAFVFNAFEIDIITYGLEMNAYSFDIYYLREFVFWFGIRILYFITHSELVTFLLLDILWIYLLYKVSRKVSVNKIGNALLIILATSFGCFPSLVTRKSKYAHCVNSSAVKLKGLPISFSPSIKSCKINSQGLNFT